MSSNEYLIVLDTNILHNSYKNRANFVAFSFNSIFYNLIDKIEKLDLYEHIKIGIPVVVWKEIIKQKYDAYNSRVKEIQKIIDNFQFPFHFIQEIDVVDYSKVLLEQVDTYKENLSKRQVKVIDLELPSSHRFDSIMARAFEKRPPFEGVESTSDKGFKDALLWESILEYKSTNPDINIILYSNDGLFCQELINEFKYIYNDAYIFIVDKKQESKLFEELELIASKVDQYSYIEDIDDEVAPIRNWLYSDDFNQQIFKFQHLLREVNKYTKLSRISIEEVYEIEQFDVENEIIKDVRINLNIDFQFIILDKEQISEKYDVVVYANVTGEETFLIDDIEIEYGGDEVE